MSLTYNFHYSELMIPLNMNNSLVYQIFNLINQIQWNNLNRVVIGKLQYVKWKVLFCLTVRRLHWLQKFSTCVVVVVAIIFLFIILFWVLTWILLLPSNITLVWALSYYVDLLWPGVRLCHEFRCYDVMVMAVILYK